MHLTIHHYHHFCTEPYQDTETIEGKLDKMSKVVDDFVASVTTAFASVNSSLDNIVADETNLAKQITDLQTQLTNSGTLSDADTAALKTMADAANAMVAKTQGITDAVPDLPTPPPVDPNTPPAP